MHLGRQRSFVGKKKKIMYNSICVTNQELNNICQETDIADQSSYLLCKKLLFLDIFKEKRPIPKFVDVIF